MIKEIRTKRLLLRALRVSDYKRLYAYAKKPHIGPMAGWDPHTSSDQSLMILKQMIDQKDVWAITPKGEENHLIGTIGLHYRKVGQQYGYAHEIGYVLDDAYWRKGLMSEAVTAVIKYAFNQLQISRVYGKTYPYNYASQRVLEKANFVYVEELFDAKKIPSRQYSRLYCLEKTKGG